MAGFGSYAICKVTVPDYSDGLILETVIWGYDSAEDAATAIARVAIENKLKIADLCVVRVYGGDELDKMR